MKRPDYLKKGDTILIIATARSRDKKAIQPAIDILEKWGLKVELGKHIFNKHHQFAGTDNERAEDLQWAVNHPTAKAVLLAGGGYGTVRVIDQVDFNPLKKFPKWFAGYSDATVLHSKLLKEKFECIHSTMAFQLANDKDSEQSLHQLLFGEEMSYHPKPHPLNKPGIAVGKLIGGNLSILYALSGSNEDLKTKNKILFIEDLDEQLYHIDRMMMQMKRSGKLSKLAGLIVGGMLDMKDNAVPYGKTAEEIIADAVKEYHYPVCFNFPAGHIKKNLAINLGRQVKLDVKAKTVTVNYLNDDF